MHLLVLLLTLTAVLAAPPKDAAVKIPAYVSLCTRDSSDVSECLKKSLQNLFPKMANGIKELDIPAIEPLYIEESSYEYGNGIASGKSVIRNALVYGLSEATVTKFQANFDDPNNIVMEMEIHEDTARLEGNYKMSGQFMNFPIKGKGPFNITGEDVTITLKMTGVVTGKNGEKYLKLKSFLITPRFGEMHFQVDNLFDGNKELSEAISGLVNQYWRIGYEMHLPMVQDTWDKIFRSVANRVFQKVPFDVLFPTSQ